MCFGVVQSAVFTGISVVSSLIYGKKKHSGACLLSLDVALINFIQTVQYMMLNGTLNYSDAIQYFVVPLVSVQPFLFTLFISDTTNWKLNKKWEKFLRVFSLTTIPLWSLTFVETKKCFDDLFLISQTCADTTGFFIGKMNHVGWMFNGNIFLNIGWVIYILTIVGTVGYRDITTACLFVLLLASYALGGNLVGPSLFCMTAPIFFVISIIGTRKLLFSTAK